MKIHAEVVADSVGPHGVRVVTLTVTMPRFLVAEFNTHRVFSRNSASSRAIPVERRIASVTESPFVPRLSVAGRGMASNESVEEATQAEWERDVLALRDAATAFARKWAKAGHKQHVNRYLEPWAWTTVVVTATEWAGFFAQRCHPAAQPEFQAVACALRDAITESSPQFLTYGAWHVPFVSEEEKAEWGESRSQRIAVGRLARVSYLTHDGRRDPEEDIRLADRLAAETPPHASPFEHVCHPVPLEPRSNRRGNLRGWAQLRHAMGMD